MTDSSLNLLKLERSFETARTISDALPDAIRLDGDLADSVQPEDPATKVNLQLLAEKSAIDFPIPFKIQKAEFEDGDD